MKRIIVNDNNLNTNDINKTASKVRAILLSDNKILVSYYGGIILFPGGSIDKGEDESIAIVRELKEETGITYNINNLCDLFLLEHYQPNYPTRNNETINRLIKTKYYLGLFKGIDLNNVSRTDNEIKGDFHLELITMDELKDSLNKESNNPRKEFFDRENNEVIKALKKIM